MTEKGNTGHRRRLRDRFLSGDAGSHSDEVLLELLLTFAIGRKDVQPLAEELVRVFGNLEKVLDASHDELQKIKGLGQASVVLLKVVDAIKDRKIPSETASPVASGRDTSQMQLFQDSPIASLPKSSLQKSMTSKTLQSETQPVPESKSLKKGQNPSEHDKAEQEPKVKQTPQSYRMPTTDKNSIRRKLQVSNSYLLEFDQLARVLNFLLEQKESKRIKRKLLKENTGLAERQIEGLVSMGTAMGLIKPNVQILTPIGVIIATHDLFMESPATLEWCHYKAATSYQNLIWFDVFNHLLLEQEAMTQEGWQEYFRSKLKGQYSDKTLKDHVHKEIRFVIDAYMERNFKKMELLQRSADGRLYRRRYSKFNPLVLTAMIYDFCATNRLQLSQVSEMATSPGSPAMAFGLDVTSFRQQIEGLHDHGWLRYETTHNLDQVRLKPGLSAINCLSAHFEGREPNEDTKPSPGGIFQ